MVRFETVQNLSTITLMQCNSGQAPIRSMCQCCWHIVKRDNSMPHCSATGNCQDNPSLGGGGGASRGECIERSTAAVVCLQATTALQQATGRAIQSRPHCTQCPPPTMHDKIWPLGPSVPPCSQWSVWSFHPRAFKHRFSLPHPRSHLHSFFQPTVEPWGQS